MIEKILVSFVFFNVLFFAFCFVLGKAYLYAIGSACLDFKRDCPSLSAPPTLYPNAMYYAAQTITTTGYGSEVPLNLRNVQVLSMLAMPEVAALWGVVLGIITSIVIPKRYR